MDVAGKPRPEREKTQRGQRRFILTEIELVGGELLNNELGKRLVLIQRADNVVAIRPRPREFLFLKKNVALVVRVTRDIEPMPRPMLAIARRFQQPVHPFGMRNAKFRIRFWWQPGEREMGAPVQHVIRRARRGLEIGGLELGEDELVDGILHPRYVLNTRRLGVADGLECPVRSLGPRGFTLRRGTTSQH